MVCSPNGLSPVGQLDNYGPFLGTQVEFPRVLLNSAGFIIYYSHHLLKMIDPVNHLYDAAADCYYPRC